MVQRDLTHKFNNPDEISNPFASPVDEEPSFELNQPSSSSQLDNYNQMNRGLNDPTYGGAFNAYNGYYSQNGTKRCIINLYGNITFLHSS